MAMKRCENGHFYDSNKYSKCPFCGIDAFDLDATDRKHPNNEEAPKDERTDKESVGPKRGQEGRPNRQGGQLSDVPSDHGETVRYMRKKLGGIDPVVGWFVCIEGAEKGRDYRIRSEMNFIGRSESMDICIKGDNTISRERHASVSYDPLNNAFMLLPGDGRSLVYLNGEPLYMPAKLKAYDAVKLGETLLMFAPFCGERFRWEADKEQDYNEPNSDIFLTNEQKTTQRK